MSLRRQRWTAADIPDQSGRIAVITGANTGLGFETARELARRGATVVLACRDLAKAQAAGERIRDEIGSARLQTVRLDLASLASVREASDQLRADHQAIDLLINNAGVMAVPTFQRSEDGHELTFATNHLGPFALTGRLLDRVLAAPDSRIVTVSSIGHRDGSMHFDDLDLKRDYHPWHAYWQSKLANLLFSYELHARLQAASADTAAVAAHPGNARTELWRWTPKLTRTLYRPRLRSLTFWFAQSAPMGALATLRAATDPNARSGDYYGPPGRLQYTGYPTRVESSADSHDVEAQRRLWTISEQFTGVSYPIATPAA